MARANMTIAILCELIKIIPIFFVSLAKNSIFFDVLQNFSN